MCCTYDTYMTLYLKILHVDSWTIEHIGFSFGGLLAIHLTAAMWKLPLITTDILKKNLACITFGQPLINLPLVKEVMEESPEFTSTVHLVFTREDTVPRVAKFLDPRIDDVCDVSDENLIKKHFTAANVSIMHIHAIKF